MAYKLEEINFKTVADPKGFVEEGDAAYQALPRPLIFHGFGTALFAFGDAGRQANIAYEIGEMPGARYYSAGGKLVGAVLTGDIRRMEEVTNLILQA